MDQVPCVLLQKTWICERRSRAMTTPPPKTPDLQTTLNRLRKNYAQNPLYVWLFSASCTTHHLLTNLSSGSHPESISRIPWCSGLVEYSSLRGTDRIRRVYLPPISSIVTWSYGTALGDSLNGAGITASWSLAYFLINSRRSLRLRGIHPLSFLVVNLAGFNALIYGSYYFLDADTARRTDI